MISTAEEQSAGTAPARAKAAAEFLKRVEGAAGALERRPKLVLLFLLALYTFCTLPQAYARLLWHDELFTYNLALEPTVRAMLRDIRRVDLNPPLLYLLDFCTLRLPGMHGSEPWVDVAARLPSLLAGVVASWGLFALLKRRLGAAFALLGVSCLWVTAFLDYTWEDRPYAIVIALTILLLLAWERATEPGRKWVRIAAVLGLGTLLAGSHFMAIFILPSFIAAELTRGWQRRKLDVALLAALVLPCIALVIYRSTFTEYGTILFPPEFQARPGMIVPEYIVLARICAIPLLACLLFLVLEQIAPQRFAPKRVWASLPEIVLLCGILLEPMAALAAVARSHGAFFLRYGLPACCAIAILTCALLWKFLRQSKAAAVVVAACLWFPPVWNATTALQVAASRSHAPLAASGADYKFVEPDLPLVAASALTYVEMNHREQPAVLHRLYFLRDKAAAIEFAHSTLFDREDVAASTFHFQSRVETLRDFEALHPRFLVLGTLNYPEDWLLRKLEADGDTVRHLGTYDVSYKDKDLYEVTLRTPAANGGGRRAEER